MPSQNEPRNDAPKATTPNQVEPEMPMPIHALENLRIPIGEQSPLTQIPIQEHIDLTRLELLNKCNDKVLLEYTGSWGKRLKNEKTHIRNLVNLAKKGQKSVKGKPIIKYDFSAKWRDIGQYAGRVYPNGSLSLGCLRAELRGFMCEGIYTDCDFNNAHPKALRQILAKSGIDVPSLNTLVETRDDLLRVMTSTLKTEDGDMVSRKRAKQLFLQILYGGKVRSWIEGKGGEDGQEQPPITNYDELPHETRAFIDTFERETKVVIDAICEANPDVVAKYTRTRANNPRASTASLFAQNLERKLLETFFDYCVKKGLTRHPKKQRQYRGQRTHDVILCFDGLMLLNEHIERSGMTIDEILREAEAYILGETGYEMGLSVKPIDYGYSMDFVMLNQLVATELTLLNDDFKLCEAIKAEYGDYIKTILEGGEQLAIYDTRRGMWVRNQRTMLDDLVLTNREKFPYDLDKDNNPIYWGASMKALASATSKYHAFARDPAWFEPEKQDNSIGKILFQDGYYDFETEEFHEGFTHEIIFHHQAPIPYNLEWNAEESGFDTMEDCMDMLRQKLLIDPANEDNHSLKAMPHYLSNAIAGTTRFREVGGAFMMGVGRTRGGKGTLAYALKGAFGDYIAEIATEYLAPPPKNTGDFAYHLKWLPPLKYKRILLAQEQPKGFVLSSALVKKLSGGDEIQSRVAYGYSQSFIPHSTLLLFANNIEGAFDEIDEAMRERPRGWRYDKKFAKEVRDPETEMLGDKDFKPKLLYNLYWRRAFAQLIINAYHHPDTEALEHSRSITRDLISTMDAKSNFINDHLIITNDYTNHYITSGDIDDIYDALLKDEGIAFQREFPNKKSLKKEIVKMGARKRNSTKQMTRNVKGYTETISKNQTLWWGVKPLTHNEEETPDSASSIIAQVGFDDAFEEAFADE